jgi:predicted GNAT family acetyltransferase
LDTSPEARARTAALRERIAAGRTVMMVAVENGEPVAVGTHAPVDVDGAEVSEIVGIATLPRFRGRGLGAGLASALVDHARETAETVFLTAGDDDVARIYERVGFARLGTTGVAEAPTQP